MTGEASVSHRFVRTVDLPNGRDAAEVWDAACQLLGGSLPSADIATLRASAAIAGYDAGEVVIEAATDGAAAILDARQDLVRRKLGLVLRRPVRIRVVGAPDGPEDPDSAPEPQPRERQSRAAKAPARIVPPPPPRSVPVFTIPECGMTTEQLWSAVLDDLRSSGAIPRAEVESWLRDSAVIGRGEAGELIIGVPHALAERRANRFLSAIAQATRSILGVDRDLEVVRTQTWLAAQDATGTEG